MNEKTMTREEALAAYEAAQKEMDEAQAALEKASGDLSTAAGKRDNAEMVLNAFRLSDNEAWDEAHAENATHDA